MDTFGFYVLLLGYTPRALGIPGIPDIGGKLKDAVVGAFEELGQRISDVMTDWATWGIESMLKILSSNLLPRPDTLLNGPISLMLGASFGLAVELVRLFTAIAVIVTVIAVARRKRTEFATGVLSSMLTMLAWLVFFFPFYTLLLTLLQALTKASLSAAADASNSNLNDLSDALLLLLLPDNLVLTFVAGLINGVVATMLICQLAALVLAGLVVTFFFPLSIALRPLGVIGLNQFRLAAAAAITVPVAILLMVLLLSLELILIRGSNSVVPFLGGFASLAFSIIFGIALLLTPYVVFMVAYTKVQEHFGNTDAKIQSGIDVLSMPDINSRQIEDNSNRDSLQYVRQFASELPGAIAAGENSPGTEAKELAKQIAIGAVMKSANPYVAAAGAAYTGIKVISKVVNPPKQDGGGTP